MAALTCSSPQSDTNETTDTQLVHRVVWPVTSQLSLQLILPPHMGGQAVVDYKPVQIWCKRVC